ncbi:hypothetical protein CU097_000545, partial [Rhizopus azygosporus]
LYDDEGGMTRDELKAQERKRKREQEENHYRELDKARCSDGRPPLKGFHVSQQNQQIGKWYPPPVVPSDFTGQHAPLEDSVKSMDVNKESVFSFEERGLALGEKPIEHRSVFDYIPKHSKDRLDQAIRFFVDSGKDKSQLADFPSVPKDVALLALKGFMPFGDNPKKQERYRNYLENHAGMLTEDGIPKKILPIPEGLTYDAAMKEMDEFAKAARIFRPISAMMSGRFTSASDAAKNVEVVSFEGGLKTEEQYRKEKEERAKAVPEPEKKQPTQEAEAAAMKMFGALTRTVRPFYPSRLVCKRFNVPNPHPNITASTDAAAGRSQAGSKEALSKEAMEAMLNERMPLAFTSAETSDDPLLKSVIPKPSERASSSDDSKAPTTGITQEIAVSNNAGQEQTMNRQESIDDEVIGPLPPPKAPTAEIPIQTNNKPEPTTEVFRPMFKRASERREQGTTALPNIVSEEKVVQPFKPRSTVSKRRRVSVSESSDEESKRSPDERATSHKEHRSSRLHRSRSSPDSSSRHSHKRSRSRERKHKSSRKRSRSRDRKSKKHKSEKHRSRKHKHHTEEDDYEELWVEKEPVLSYRSNESNDGRRREGRLRAADLW